MKAFFSTKYDKLILGSEHLVTWLTWVFNWTNLKFRWPNGKFIVEFSPSSSMTRLRDVGRYRLSQLDLGLEVTLYEAALPIRSKFHKKSDTLLTHFSLSTVYLFGTQSDNDNLKWINVYKHTNLVMIISALWTTSEIEKNAN